MSKKEQTNNDKLKDYIDQYVRESKSLPGKATNPDELEVRFGTNWFNPITKIKFDFVIEKLKSMGWNTSGFADYHMNIQSQIVSLQTGKTTIGNIRTEIQGLTAIQKYCNTNNINLEESFGTVNFIQKFTKQNREGGKFMPIDYRDFEFRVNYKTEKRLLPKFDVVKSLVRNWKNSKKVFRYIKRYTFTHNNFPFKIDCSIIKSSSKNRNRMIPEYTVEKSNVFNNPTTYEIEIELLHEAVSLGADYTFLKMREGFKLILSGLQQTNFPTAYTKNQAILQEYMKLTHQTKTPIDRRIKTRDFIGPSSISLELPNISPIDQDAIFPNINKPYTVTEKADGIRKLLYIGSSGLMWLIDVNMNVQFTGAKITNEDYFDSIIDGEHVLHDKNGMFIDTYLAFDLYFVNGEDYRGYPLLKIQNLTYDNPDIDKNKFRYNTLRKLLKSCEINSVTPSKPSFKIKAKTFYTNEKASIFTQCKFILDGVADGTMFEYETDGLIFTPIDKSVGSDILGEWLDPVKKTWKWVMKWKPPEFNTIDFLVTTKKTQNGQDFIGNIFENGKDLSDNRQITQFKTLELRCGYSERDHGYINPCQEIIEDKLSRYSDRDDSRTYKPVKFQPVDPTPNFDAWKCNIKLEVEYEGKYMVTEDKLESFDDETIVEFKYDSTRPKHWQWIPIRVRYDKTADYKKGLPNYGNAFHVAQSVWRSIHNPITVEMLSTGKNIPNEIVDEDVYYNTRDTTITKPLRNFHNLYVKRKLINGASKRGGTIIDFAVGKAGDLPKWISSKQSFVFGIDISPDNIENRKDGACARYLNMRKKFRSVPKALFTIGDSSKNIRSGDAALTEKSRQITQAIFGYGTHDEEALGRGVYNQFGKGETGFDLVSVQFAMHYFFEDHTTLQNFVRNISECCKVNGHFIGTCYDGLKVFRALENKEVGGKIVIMEGKQKMWEVTKQYDRDTFDNDASCLGYQIDVYQESINKVFSEYLVNFDYFIRIMENYGLIPITRDEAREMKLPNAIGSFQELFVQMNNEIREKKLREGNVGDAVNMTEREKRVSFLNNYFVFKKVRDVDTEAVYKTNMGVDINKSVKEEEVEITKTIVDQLEQQPEKEPKRKTKKRKKRVKIVTQ
jgi:hypothetical protein